MQPKGSAPNTREHTMTTNTAEAGIRPPFTCNSRNQWPLTFHDRAPSRS